jgi:uncharacterized protein (TIRG00374 family)
LPPILKNILQIILFFGVGFTILYFVYQNQNTAFQAQCAIDGIPTSDCSLLNKIWQDFRTIDAKWLFLVLILFNISNIARAARWRMMMQSLNYDIRLSNAFYSVMIGYFANLGLPRAGEILRATVLSKYEKIRVEKVIGTIALDRILDVISILVIVGFTVLLEFDLILQFLKDNSDGSSNGIPNWAIISGISLVVLLIIIGVFRNKLMELSFVRRFIQLLLGFWEGVVSIRTISRPWLFIFYSLVIWLMYFGMTYVCFFAFEPTAHLGLRAALIVFVFGTFGVIIPSPGGMGTFHALAVIALAIFGIAGDDAFSFANILFFSVQIGCSVLLGIIAIIALPILNRGYSPDRPPVL